MITNSAPQTLSQLLVLGANNCQQQNNFASTNSQQVPYTEQSNQGDSNNGAQGFIDDDSSEVLSFVLTGGPKWGFRIKQLQDGRVIISRIDKGPAEKCGLRVYDEILSVNNVQLINSPCSLLLQEHQQCLEAAAPAPDRAPLLGAPFTPSENKPEEQQTPLRVELSKLDFAYQLIKHSSGVNNKLMLTVKRFLSFSYARASVLAASGSPWLPTAATSKSQHQQQKILFDWSAGLASDVENLWPGSKRNDFISRTRAMLTGSDQQQQRHTIKRPHTAGSVYKCCDCYCNQEGE